MSPEPALDDPPLGPGRLVLVVGPSGAGKDTLLRRARAALESRPVRPAPAIHFVRRVVTRQADANEDHASMSEAEFAAAAARGAFLLVWQAHGLSYGVPRGVEADLRSGATAVINASRTIIPLVRRRFARTGIVVVTAPRQIRAERLAARGRDGDAEQRLARDLGQTHDFAPDLVIDNAGSIEAAAERLIEFLSAAEPLSALRSGSDQP